MTALYSLTIPVALSGNLLLIFIVTRRPETRSLTGLLFVNMAAADLLVTLVSMPIAIATPYTNMNWLPGVMGNITCKAAFFGFFVTITASILSLTLMAVERYLGVMFPFRRLPLLFRSAKRLTLVIWLSSTIVMIPAAVSWKLKKGVCLNPFEDVFGDFEKDVTFFYLYLFLLNYLIPLLVISVLYGLVSRKLWRENIPGEHLVSSDVDSKRHQNTKKIVRTLVTITAAFAVCWLPAQAYQLLLAIDVEFHMSLSQIVMYVCNWCGHSNSALNPWLYMLLTTKFRRALRDVWAVRYLKIGAKSSYRYPDRCRETNV